MTQKLQRACLMASALALAVLSAAPAAQNTEQKQEQPRFRGGANLVRVDAYVSRDGQPIADLTADDFEVLEDGAPQRIESFQVIRARGPVPQAARVEPNTVAEARAMAADADARLFVLFLDVWHVHVEGSFRAQNPIINLLDRAVGQDDLIGVMTPEMSARNLTLARRTTTIEGILRDNWYWGQRQRLNTADPREQELQMCYPDSSSETAGIAQELIDRRRERKTLDAIEDLIIHLEGIREERKFVILLSEGWRLPRRDDRLARKLAGFGIPGTDPIGVGPTGKLTSRPAQGAAGTDSCERERQRLAAEDLELDFRTLLQRANRANVTFYTVDPRGLVVFDEDLSTRRATDVIGDRERLSARQDSLRDLAANTDGVAILNTNNIEAPLQRILADTSSYYLLGYYSTNTKLDGKFRKLTVRVKKPGFDVRARPGYLAPTEAELAVARVDRLMNGAAPGHSDIPPELRRALDKLAPSRASVPMRVQVGSGGGRIWLTTELDATVVKSPEWQKGGMAHIVVEHERGAAAPIQRDVTLESGQRMFKVMDIGPGSLPPGRYVIRLSLAPTGGSLPLQTTVDVTVPDAAALIGTNGLALRRGPATGLAYVATADARFQRTERIRFEVPRLSSDGTVSARLINRSGQQLPLEVALGERDDDELHLHVIVADLTLAALGQGEYILEIAVEKEGKTERASYPFRLVP